MVTDRSPSAPRTVPVLISVTDLIAHLWLKLFNKSEDRQRTTMRPKNTRLGRGRPKKGQILIYKRQDKRLIIYLYPRFVAREGRALKTTVKTGDFV